MTWGFFVGPSRCSDAHVTEADWKKQAATGQARPEGSEARRPGKPMPADARARAERLRSRLDYLDTMRELQQRLNDAEGRMLSYAVGARRFGASWADIGEALGASRQTAHRRFAARVAEAAPSGGQV